MARLIAIDPEVMSNKKLDLLDKLLLCYVLDWEKKNSVCFAKDQFFSLLFGVSEAEVLIALHKLEGLGLIKQIAGTGGRLIKSVPTQTEVIPWQDLDIFQI